MVDGDAIATEANIIEPFFTTLKDRCHATGKKTSMSLFSLKVVDTN
jgi:hypothetical protein